MSRSLLADWRDQLRDSTLDATAKLVGFVLSTYMDAGGYAFPSKNTIAAGSSLGKGKRSVDQAVDRLEAAGLLHIARSAGRSSFRYQALLPTAQGMRRSEEGNVASDDAQRRTKRAPTSHQVRPKAPKALKARTDAAAPAGASSVFRPMDNCPDCGKREELVGPDFIYCRGCAVGHAVSGEA